MSTKHGCLDQVPAEDDLGGEIGPNEDNEGDNSGRSTGGVGGPGWKAYAGTPYTLGK